MDGKLSVLEAGQACLIFPNQIHELHTPEHSRHYLCIFSPKHVHTYEKRVALQVPTKNLFSPDPFYLQQLIALRENDDILYVKGLLYSLCAEFDCGRCYTARKVEQGELLFRIFRFVETNFSGECTLAALAAETSYHYVYLSKYFKQCTGVSFTEYVNRCRVNEACYLLKNTDRTVLQAALDCGFDSLRSFNRNFKAALGITPTEYRMRNAK